MQKFSPESIVNSQEFCLISAYFTKSKHNKIIGIGDDAAVIEVDHNQQLLSTVDTMVEGIHFLKDDDPYALGFKLLAVNLSDIAAMGGTPKWASLALTLTEVNHKWLHKFSQGLFDLAKQHDVVLIGGDTTKGENLVMSLQLLGAVANGKVIKRSRAKVGDLIFVTGNLGGASFQLQQKLNGITLDLNYLPMPQAKVETGKKLLNIANAMIDVSDGLLQDLSHVLCKSDVGAEIDVSQIPLAPEIKNHQDKYKFALTGGEDYQLLFTAAKHRVVEIEALNLAICKIGEITASPELKIVNCPELISIKGFNHF